MSTRLADFLRGDHASPAAHEPVPVDVLFARRFDFSAPEPPVSALPDTPAAPEPFERDSERGPFSMRASGFSLQSVPGALAVDVAYDLDLAPASFEQPYEPETLPPAFDIAYSPGPFAAGYNDDDLAGASRVRDKAGTWPEMNAFEAGGLGSPDVAGQADALPPAGAAIAPLPSSADEREDELVALKDRLSYYGAFDALISDNIHRSADLFRALYEERERVRREAEESRAEIEAAATLEAERRLGAERRRFQSTLMSLMDEASRMQRQIDGLVQRIAEAITESTVSLTGDPSAGDDRRSA